MHIQRTQLQELCDKATSVALFVHRNPDGDCLGSGLALGMILEQQGKQVTYVCPTPPSHIFSFLPAIQKYQTTFDYGIYDLCMFVDTANPHTMLSEIWEGHEAYFTQQTKVNIDHHISNTIYGNLNIIDAQASSVCELLTEIIQNVFPQSITPDIATYLFMGLSTDTGNFMYDKDSTRTFTAATYLLEQGANKTLLTQHLYRSKNYDQVKALHLLLERMTRQGKVIYSRYTQEDLDTYNMDKEQIEAFLPLMTSIEHDGIFALFKTSAYDLNPLLRCSLRTNSDTYDVSYIAGHFNGGGHQAAAGCALLIKKDITTSMHDMVDKINSLLST